MERQQFEISTIILAYNEEIHIERCIRNAQKYAKEIFVVDSFSTDQTREIAEKLGAKVYQHEFRNYAAQFQWALDNLPIQTEWVWRQDADEYLSDELVAEIKERLVDLPDDISGFTAPCLRIFMGKYIKHGIVPLILLRLFKYKYGSIEQKMMDEHIQLSQGRVEDLKNPFYDDNLNGLAWWTNKHNGYSDREALDLLFTEYGSHDETPSTIGSHSASVRKKKLKYVKLPLFWRAFAFFCYRYFIRLGFLDGKEGFLWHFLQGFWYRLLADAKVFEIKKRFNWNRDKIVEYLKTFKAD